MHKFICPEFEIDLTAYKVSIVDDNHWFSDSFYTKYSYPIDILLSGDMLVKLGHLLDDRFQNGESLYTGVYVHNDRMESATFEVEDILGLKISANIRFGFDELPSFSKKLSELSLDKFELPANTSIYDYAVGIITQGWPAVNFNFPQVHTDKFDLESDIWFAFSGRFNNYVDGEFPNNYVDTDEDITYNRNIIQPLAYLLHILTRGFADAGKVLMGDVLTDPYIQKELVFADADYVTTVEQESIPLTVLNTEAVVNANATLATYNATVAIPDPGRYRIVGNISIKHHFSSAWARLKYRGNVIWEYSAYIAGHTVKIKSINVVFDTLADLLPNDITFESQQWPPYDVPPVVCDLNINPVRLHDLSGNAIPTVLNLNMVDLTKAVPDCNFSDIVKYVKNKYNIGLEDKGNNEIWMNYVQNEVRDRVPIDLSAYEVPKPFRKLNRGMSFLLKFQDVSSEDYTFHPVFHSATEISNSSFVQNEKTQEIIIEGLTLPQATRNNIQTAHAFETGNKNKIFTVLYDGLQGGLNLTIDPTPILLPAVHSRHHKEWFDNRITAVNYQWSFKMTPEALRLLTSKSKIFAYGRYHILKSLPKNQISPEVWEVEIDGETLK